MQMTPSPGRRFRVCRLRSNRVDLHVIMSRRMLRSNKAGRRTLNAIPPRSVKQLHSVRLKERLGDLAGEKQVQGSRWVSLTEVDLTWSKLVFLAVYGYIFHAPCIC